MKESISGHKKIEMKSFNAQTTSVIEEKHEYKDEKIQTDENFFSKLKDSKPTLEVNEARVQQVQSEKKDKEIQKDFKKIPKSKSIHEQQNLFEKLAGRRKSRRSSNKSTPNTSRIIKDIEIGEIRNDSFSNISNSNPIPSPGINSKTVKDIIGELFGS